MKYKNIYSAIHNFGHSFLSLMNYVDGVYIIDDLTDIMKKGHDIEIDWLNGEFKLDSSSDCQRFQTGLIFSQQHRPSRTDITNQTGFQKAVEGNTP